MAAWVCVGCSTTYSVGAPCCPHCLSTEHEEDGAMPKITRHGGPTVAGASIVGGAWSDSDAPDQWPEPADAGAVDDTPAEAAPAPWGPEIGEHGPELIHFEGGEQSSAGSSSETSSEKPPTSPETSKRNSPSPARKTGSRSGKARTGSPSARGTDGDQETGTSDSDEAAG